MNENELETLIVAVATALMAYTNALRSDQHTTETQRCFRTLCRTCMAVFNQVDEDRLEREQSNAALDYWLATSVYESACAQLDAVDALWRKVSKNIQEDTTNQTLRQAAQEEKRVAAEAFDRTYALSCGLSWLLGHPDLPDRT